VPTSPVLQAIVEALVQATGAQAGWIVADTGDHLEVRAAAGDGSNGLVGRSVPSASGSVGFVVASGQPLALAGTNQDPRLAEGVTRLAGVVPRSLVCVPCDTPEGVVGALEAVEKTGAASFTFDDIEFASLLARIAAAEFASSRRARALTSPAELGRELQHLAESDATRYAMVATIVEALLARG
jgi:GAF domain-containing protein